MKLTLLLPWFPIILAVGVGGRLLGRGRGFALGLVCALFWIVLAQASDGLGLWRDPWATATIIIGAFAIFVMGGWSAGGSVEELAVGGSPASIPPQRAPTVREGQRYDGASDEDAGLTLHRFAAAIDRFDDWIEEHRGDANPWPHFAEFVRAVLYDCAQATHVKCYRLCGEGEELQRLRDGDPFADASRLSARRGIVGHVLTTTRPYLADDRQSRDREGAEPDLVGMLAEESDEALAWCFPITRATERLGVVSVGHLGVAPERSRALLAALGRLVAQFWCTLLEAVHGRTAGEVDAVSGMLTRRAFLHAAQQALRESCDQNEPVAVVVIALQGLRELNDSGRWEVADELIGEVGDVLRRKVRTEDRLGRFDGSRFIWLLRRVDSQLAALIVKQVMSRLVRVCADQTRWRASVKVRCGLTGSGLEKLDLRTLVSRALAQSHRARVENLAIATDLQPHAITAESTP